MPIFAVHNKIFMEDRQKKLTDKFLLFDFDKYPVGLFHGKMGLCIYFFHMSQIESNQEYQSIAGQLLDQILQHNLSPKHSIAVEDGLAGVGLGVIYLTKNQYIKGDLNMLLEGIDNAIYRKIAFLEKPSNFSSTLLLHLIVYLYIRLKDQTDINSRMFYQDWIIKILNMLYDQIDDEFLSEAYSFSVFQYQVPVLLRVVSNLLDAGFYNDRIYKMLNELQLRILSRFPLLHSNRLFLLWGMLNLAPYLHDAAWSNYIQLLYREIHLNDIFENEMKDRKIFISNGLSMIYILLHAINRNFPDYPIPFDPQTIYNQLQNSEAWNILCERDYFYNIHQGLLNGFPGVQLVLSHITKHYHIITNHK